MVTHHKPLVKVFSDRTLDEITNTRLFRLKQRTLPWYFKVAYLPGKSNCAADATSRHPCPTSAINILSIAEVAENHTTVASVRSAVNMLSIADVEEHHIVASIRSDTTNLTSISWKTLEDETKHDSVLSQLTNAIQNNFQCDVSGISSFLRYRDCLYIDNGVIMYQDRVVVPKSLRASVLDSLHAAHQGVAAMQLRAQAIVFWPGISLDIEHKRSSCHDCNRNSPSQAVLPTEPANPPSTPFEQIFADFFEFGGHHYLVAGDRLSGFTEVFYTPSGTSNAGASGLIKCLRKWFGTFGIPQELSSDGGPEFSASVTTQFLKEWDVRHRVSSAYNPRSNGRAEVAVKTVKRMMRSNVGPNGSLNTDSFLKAILQLRNTPDPDCGYSPAEIVFGRRLRDNLLFSDYVNRGQYSKRWQQAWVAKEDALRARFVRTAEKINCHARFTVFETWGQMFCPESNWQMGQEMAPHRHCGRGASL